MCPPFWKAALALFVTIHFCLFARESISVCVALHWISVVQLCLVSSDLSSYRSELVHLVLFSQRMNMAFEYNLHVSNAQSLCEQLTGCLHWNPHPKQDQNMLTAPERSPAPLASPSVHNTGFPVFSARISWCKEVIRMYSCLWLLSRSIKFLRFTYHGLCQ